MKPRIGRVMSNADIIKNIMNSETDVMRKKSIQEGTIELENYKSEKKISDLFAKKDYVEESNKKYYDFSNKVKTVLLSECIGKIYKNSLPDMIDNKDSVLASTNYVDNFIKEHGVDILLGRFKTKTLLLSELSLLVEKHHKKIIEKADKDDEESIVIDDEDRDEFLKDLDEKPTDKISDIVKDRVEKSVDKFISDNAEDTEKIKEIISKSKDSIENAKSDSIAESYKIIANKRLQKIKSSRNQSILEAMILNVSNSIYKNELLKEAFLNEEDASINIDKVLESVVVMYTFLETVNTTKMVDVDFKYLDSIVSELKA